MNNVFIKGKLIKKGQEKFTLRNQNGLTLRDQGGFTLIELLLSISLLAISVGISSDIIVTLVRTNSKAQIFNDIETSSNFVFHKMQNDIKNSVVASINSSGTTLTLTKKDGTQITYAITSDNPPQLTRDGLPLFDNSSVIGGVRISCNGDCFELVNSTPATIKVNFTFSQASGVGIFNTSVSLEDAFVLRGTY